ncbi:S8 family serine peptidase [Bacillus sp. JJ1566]|uniref:S8 family serine peptidase n=1 Tax=Bacillus sp. JJ1566 TaxID=3122961 RepID=UPI00300096DB
MRRNGKRKLMKVASVLMCALLLVPSVTSQAFAQSKDPSISYLGSKNEVASSKISESLKDQFADDKMVTFLVKFKEQVDSKAIANEATKKASLQKATVAQTKSIKRNAIVSELRTTAIETQGNVKAYLEKEEAAGNAKDIKSFFIVNGMGVTATKDVMEKIASFPEVEKVLPNETRQLHAPAKVETSVAVETKASPQNIEWNIDRVGAPQVWEMGIDGSGTVVASIDTGVQWNHPALMEQYRGYDPANPSNPNHQYSWFDSTSAGRSTPYDDIGHGTHVTGTMVGAEPNGANQIGVAPGAKWIAVKAFTSAGGTDFDLLEAGDWIIAPGGNPDMAPDVVNNSWGGGRGLDEWYRPMVQNWRAAEIFPEFSAGNTTLSNPGGPGSIANPANYPESFATGATDINNRLASFSLQGPSPYPGDMKPDISAPGVNIRSSVPGSGYEGGWNGTSMAGPHISAVVALLKQANASLTIDEIEEIITTTATPLTDGTFTESPNFGYGYGLVNAYLAVSSVASGLGKIKGQVAKDGVDEAAPTFEHTAPSETYAGMDLPLSISVQDNVSITSVVLQYENQAGEWVNVAATQTSGTYKEGTYEAVIPGEEISVPSVSYRFQVVDFGQNDVTTDVYEVSVKPGISVGYFQDFESNPVGWFSYGAEDSWQWGAPTSGPNSAYSGEKVYATNLSGTYASRANMTLVMPPIDIPAEGPAYLQYMNWYNLERNWDFGHVFVSTDMENWTQLRRITDISSGWQSAEVDLSAYAGQRIYIGFNVTTDGSVVRDGWYIDDVRLSNEPLTVGSTDQSGEVPTKGEALVDLKEGEKVDPAKIKPEGSHINMKEVNVDKVNPQALPLNAQVSIVESGRSVTTNPATGAYELIHGTGNFTVVAESYGYHSAQQTVTVEADGEAVANFVLEEKAQGTVSGTITNAATGQPVSGATLLLVEDANITPVETDENGQYSLTAYEGTYTVRVMAPSYYSESFEVVLEGDGALEQNVELRPFIGYPGEIGYDDGTAENARAFYDAGNGWAVKMSLAEGQNKALVTGGLFRFWDTSWPNPGGTEFKVEVWDATGTDGAPGKKLAGPIDATALRTGAWTNVDLSGEGIIVEGDFYMVYIQTKPNPNAPGLATDEDGQYSGRSWQFVGGAWSLSPEAEGNYMIRATVNHEVTAPTITSPVTGSFTNESTVTVAGKAAPTTTVHVFNNGEEVATTDTTAEGTYSVAVELQVGENTLTAKASTATGITDESEAVVIVLDQTSPELAITSPENGLKTNQEAITVTGTVQDENIDSVTVNGESATIKDGSFTKRVLVENGENNIDVVATDKAGNSTSDQVTVFAKFGEITVSNLKPTEDVHLKSGESVKIEFTSEPGLNASYAIRIPLTNAGLSNVNELPLQEVSPGVYEGYWTAVSSVVANGAEIEVIVRDEFGNEARQIATGKLIINVQEDDGKPGKGKPGKPGKPDKPGNK